MVEVDLKDENGGMIASSSRATMLPYECDMVSTIRKCILIAPLIFGWMSEVKRVIVPSLDHFVESFEQPLASVEIRLVTFNSNLNFAQEKSFSPVIQVIHAELWIGKKLNILQRVMKEFFITCFIFGTFLLIIIQGLCIFSLKACYDIYYSCLGKQVGLFRLDCICRWMGLVRFQFYFYFVVVSNITKIEYIITRRRRRRRRRSSSSRRRRRIVSCVVVCVVTILI